MSVVFQPFNANQFTGERFFVIDKAVSIGGIPKDLQLKVRGGEGLKSFFFVQKLIKILLDKNFSRSLTLVAAGGGSLLDAVSFAASIYKRGVKIVKVPTTLLAAIDGVIGGKNAVNIKGVKNAAGTFYDGEVVIDLNLLNTLNEREILNGLGEIVKYTFLSEKIDGLYASYSLEKPLKLPSRELIEACVAYKNQIVSQDYYDKGARRVLNMGHTLGHAFEIIYNIPHGQAVLQGLYYELKLSYDLGLIDKETFLPALDKITKLIIPKKTLNIDKALRLCQNDKKNGSGIYFELYGGNYGTAGKVLTADALKEFLSNVF